MGYKSREMEMEMEMEGREGGRGLFTLRVQLL